MDEYIKRDGVLSKFNIDDMMNVNGTLISLHDARETISNFPAADVAPVRHGKWISVKDRLPEPTYCVLVVGAYGEMEIDALGTDGEWMGMVEDVTHWMPLPEPPKGDADNG